MAPYADSLLERHRVAFAIVAAREKLAARIAENPARFEFDGQEGAGGALILEHFLLELGKQGIPAEAVLAPAPGTDVCETERVLRGLEQALARVRTLLVEFNSYLSGGLPYVFATELSLLRERGLVVYRYPARAAVEVSADRARGSVRIAFAPGELGEVTSSGFFVPTRLAGDLEARVRYRLGTWSPGPDSACLALFAQNESSTLRYYAQLSAWGTPARLAAQASFRGETGEPRRIEAGPGELRLRRRGDTFAAWQRAAGGEWLLLGERAGEPADELVLGCKIWSKVRCGGLEAELSELEIEGTPARDQGPPPAVRPDPRAAEL
jgi:hypothetical protein